MRLSFLKISSQLLDLKMLNSELDTNLIAMFQGEEIHRTNDENIFAVDISNIAKKDSDMARFVPILGRLVYEEYRKKKYDETNVEAQKAVLEELNYPLKGANKILIALNDGKVAGYASLEFYKSRQVAFIRDIIVDPVSRGTGLGKRLYRQMFEDEKTAAIISYTKTPEAAHLRIKLAEEYGYQGFFGDMGTEKKEVRLLQSLVINHLKHEGFLADRVAPQGFVFLKGEEEILSPLKAEDVKFPLTHVLYPEFQRLLALQASCPEHTAAGLLVTFSPNFDQSLLK